MNRRRSSGKETNMETIEYYKRINNLLLALEATFRSVLRSRSPRMLKLLGLSCRISKKLPSSGDPRYLCDRFNTLGKFSVLKHFTTLQQELSFSAPKLGLIIRGDEITCPETNVISKYIQRMIEGFIGSVWYEDDIWGLSKTELTLDEKRQFVLGYLTSFAEAVKKWADSKPFNGAVFLNYLSHNVVKWPKEPPPLLTWSQGGLPVPIHK